MSTILFDHLHLRSRDPDATAMFLNRHFDFEIVDRLQLRGLTRVVLSVGGVAVFVEGATTEMPLAPAMPFCGIEHLCIRVSDLDAHVGRLQCSGVVLHTPVATARPGVRTAFAEAPDGIMVEIVERTSPPSAA